MVIFTHPVPINDPDSPDPRLNVDRIWELLVEKASHPVNFVPSITRARVIESTSSDEFVREIVLRDDLTVRERVTLEPRHRIVFHQLDNPDLTKITNELDESAGGGLTFTLSATLSAAGIERSRRESGFIAENDLLFYDTARATVNTIRLLAEIPVNGRYDAAGFGR